MYERICNKVNNYFNDIDNLSIKVKFAAVEILMSYIMFATLKFKFPLISRQGKKEKKRIRLSQFPTPYRVFNQSHDTRNSESGD